MNINSELPKEIIEVIFSKLRGINLPICRLVCRSWNDLVLNYVSNETFLLYGAFWPQNPPKSNLHYMEFNNNNNAGKHLLRKVNFTASFSYDSCCFSSLHVRMINSCNGLLLCIVAPPKSTSIQEKYVAILNPATNQHIKFWNYACFFFYGFGFNPRTKRYKIVEMPEHGKVLKIYTCGRNSITSYVRCSASFRVRTNAHYFDGALYWIGVLDSDSTLVICRLDLDEEEKGFEFTHISPRDGNLELCGFVIGTLSGTVYASFCHPQSGNFEIWMMKSSNGGKKDYSWRREFVCDYPKVSIVGIGGNQCRLLKTFGNGEILCLITRRCFFLYDPKTKTMSPLIDDEPQKLPIVGSVLPIESLNFDSLPNIMAGGDL